MAVLFVLHEILYMYLNLLNSRAFVEVGDFQSAVCWMDSVFARDNNDGVIKPVALAKYIKVCSCFTS